MSKKREPQVIIPLSEYEQLKQNRYVGVERFNLPSGAVAQKTWHDGKIVSVRLPADEYARMEADAKRWRTFDKMVFGGEVTACIDDVIQMRENAKLGALVREMPVGSSLRCRCADLWEASVNGCECGRSTPEEALRAALGKEPASKT
jgi:hypothetical protein